MAVQLHYYGSVFELDSKNPDLFWYGYIHSCISDIETGTTEVDGIYVTLEGGREAVLPYAPGDRFVLVAPAGTGKADLARHLRAYKVTES